MTAVAPDPLIGRVIDGKYQIEARIGSGGMGTAYKALHVSLGAPRAIKVMKRELADDKGLVDRFQNEARLAEGLRHPHLVALYDFAQLPDGSWFIVSEFVEGDTLAVLLDRGGRFASTDVSYLLGQIADGLAVAHRKGIIHRDITPDNIMVTKDEGGQPLAKLLDFGIAKRVVGSPTNQTGASLMLGKLGYASPEQLGLLPEGEGIDGRTDVFSLAAVAYEMLTGGLPWRKDSLQSYVHDALVRPEVETQEAIRATLPTPWQGVLSRGLARHRTARIPTMQALKAEMLEAARRVSREDQRREAPTADIVVSPEGAGRRRGLPRGPLRWGWATHAAIGLSVVALLLAVGSRVRRPGGAPPSQAQAHGTATATPALDAGRTAPAISSPGPVGSPRLEATPGDAELAAGARARTAAPAISNAQPPPRSSTTAAGRPAPPTPAAPVTGSLVVSALPPAAVTLDGQPRGRTPLTLSDLAPGPHAVVLTADDGRSFQEVVEVRAGATAEQSHRFADFGSLSVTSDVWYEVSVDGGPAQQTPFHIARLAAGRHTVRVSRPGYKPRNLDVEIQEGETRRLNVVLERE